MTYKDDMMSTRLLNKASNFSDLHHRLYLAPSHNNERASNQYAF